LAAFLFEDTLKQFSQNSLHDTITPKAFSLSHV
jgi:hypothetical protein